MGYKKYKLLIEHFLDAIIKRFKKRLSELGAKKIIPEDGRWYWDLKPDWRPGEVVEITL